MTGRYGENTPKKSPQRAATSYLRQSDSIWHFMKRLKTDEVMHGTKVKKKKVVPFTYTHVCILCWRRIRLGWDKSREGWVTTEGQAHINEYHKSEKQKDKLVKEKLEKTEKKHSFLMKGMAAAGDPRSGASSAFGLSPGQYAKTKAARYYIYGQARVSKMTFCEAGARTAAPAQKAGSSTAQREKRQETAMHIPT